MKQRIAPPTSFMIKPAMRWSVSAELAAVASDWGIDPERDLRYLTAEAAR